MGLFLWESMVAFLGGCGAWFSIDCSLYVGSGFCLSFLCPMCGRGLFVRLPVGIGWFLYRADAPFPMFIGELLSDFRCLWRSWLLVFLVDCGALPFW